MLDFTALNNDRTKRPASPAKEEGNIKLPEDLQAAPTGLIGAKYGEKRKKESETSLPEAGKELNRRLQRAEMAIHTYYKAVRDGRPPEEVALIAARALSLAVSDSLIYSTISGQYGERYGIRTEDEPPYNIILGK